VKQAIDNNVFHLLNILEGNRGIDYVHYTAFPGILGESDFICHKGSKLLFVIEVKTSVAVRNSKISLENFRNSSKLV